MGSRAGFRRRLAPFDVGGHFQLRGDAGWNGCRGRNGSRPTLALGPANLGGPLVNLKGEVVGITAALAGTRCVTGGMNLVVPAARVRRIAADLVEFGQVRRGYLGVQVEPVDPLSRPAHAGAIVISSVGSRNAGGRRPGFGPAIGSSSANGRAAHGARAASGGRRRNADRRAKSRCWSTATASESR